jgi:hypothetical protein
LILNNLFGIGILEKRRKKRATPFWRGEEKANENFSYRVATHQNPDRFDINYRKGARLMGCPIKILKKPPRRQSTAAEGTLAKKC